jgi:type II secretion system protein N
MAFAKKEALYWTACLLYGLVLTGMLLYLRFPAEKFRNYCERRVEELIPMISCSIAKIDYALPLRIVFADVRITDVNEGAGVLYEDPRLSIGPVWNNPLSLFRLRSAALGGNHQALLRLNSEERSLDFSEIQVAEVDLGTISFFQEKLERKVSGSFTMSGNVRVQLDGFRIIAADGTAAVTGGEFALKAPILELPVIELGESSVHFYLENDTMVLTAGILKNTFLNVAFEGNITLAPTWLDSTVNVKGAIVPLAPLFQQKRQLKTIVTRMQKKYQKEELPCLVGGTLGRPTFAFGN